MIRMRKIILLFYLVMAIILGLLFFILFSEWRHTDLDFYVFDVGEGDATLIRTPYEQNILIDGGPDNTVIYKLGQYLPFYERQIDLVILTHPHSDHLTGLIEVLKRYKVKEVFMTGVKYDTSGYLSWQKLIKEKGIIVRIIDQPQDVILVGGIHLFILSPQTNFLDQQTKFLNNTSIVAKLVYQDFSAMLTGDFEAEEDLVKRKFDLSSLVLKVGHHGSDNANDLEFLQTVNPTFAAISAGRNNKFGHPHLKTLKNLQKLKAIIFRTDLDGDIRFSSDGQKTLVKIGGLTSPVLAK